MHSNTLKTIPDDVPLAEAAPPLYEQPIQGLPAQLNESVHRPTIFFLYIFFSNLFYVVLIYFYVVFLMLNLSFVISCKSSLPKTFVDISSMTALLNK